MKTRTAKEPNCSEPSSILASPEVSHPFKYPFYFQDNFQAKKLILLLHISSFEKQKRFSMKKWPNPGEVARSRLGALAAAEQRPYLQDAPGSERHRQQMVET